MWAVILSWLLRLVANFWWIGLELHFCCFYLKLLYWLKFDKPWCLNQCSSLVINSKFVASTSENPLLYPRLISSGPLLSWGVSWRFPEPFQWLMIHRQHLTCNDVDIKTITVRADLCVLLLKKFLSVLPPWITFHQFTFKHCFNGDCWLYYFNKWWKGKVISRWTINDQDCHSNILWIFITNIPLP